MSDEPNPSEAGSMLTIVGELLGEATGCKRCHKPALRLAMDTQELSAFAEGLNSQLDYFAQIAGDENKDRLTKMRNDLVSFGAATERLAIYMDAIEACNHS